MSTNNIIAKADVTIDATAEKVWDALTNPTIIKQYMMGTDTKSDWKEGSPITWTGEMKGKPYQDKGKIISIVENKQLSYTHFSPMAGKPDVPENYHLVTINLTSEDQYTKVVLMQDNNATQESKSESEKNWTMMLDMMKKVIQKS